MNATLVVLGTLLVAGAWWMLLRAMPPAYRGAREVGAAARRALRIAATLALLASLACYIAAIGIEQGPVFWTCTLMLGALAVALSASLGAAGGRRRGEREPR